MGWALVAGLFVLADPVAEAAAPVTVRGRVTDLGGVPLANIEVNVVQFDRLGPYSIGKGLTDDAGRYRFSFSGAEVVGSSPHVLVWSSDFRGPAPEVGSLPVGPTPWTSHCGGSHGSPAGSSSLTGCRSKG